MAEVEVLLRDYGRRRRPITVAELEARLELTSGDNDMTATESFDGQVAETGTYVCDSCGADLTVVDLRGPDASPEPRQRKRRAAVLAVAAAILLVVGIVAVPDRNGSSVETDPVTAATSPDPLSTPTPPDRTTLSEPAGPPPSVVDSLGYRWSRVPNDNGVFDDAGLSAVIADGPGLVAVGWVGPEPVRNAAVWTSVDGLAWTPVPHDEAVFGDDEDNTWINTVVSGGSGLIAYGTKESKCSAETSQPFCDERSGVLWTSVDGLTWKRGVPSGFVPEGGVTVGGPGFVAVGENERGSEVWTSGDGVTWSRVPHNQEVFGHRIGHGNGMGAVTVGGPGLVAVGSDGVWSDNPTGEGQAIVWTSVDGLTWSRVPHDESVFDGDGDQVMFDVTAGGPGLVAVGSDAQGAPVWTSTDGIRWSQIPDPGDVFGGPGQAGTYSDAQIFSVTSAGRGLVAVGNEPWDVPAVWTSVDGITWARVEDRSVFGVGGPLRDVTVGGPGLVAVGSWYGPATVLVATPEN